MSVEEISLTPTDLNCPSGFKIIGKKVYMPWGESEKTGLNRLIALEQILLTDEEVKELGVSLDYSKNGTGNYAMIYAVAKSANNGLSECLGIHPSDKHEIRMGAPHYKCWGTEIGDMMMTDSFWKTDKEVEQMRVRGQEECED